jgi:hypothetical protein
MTDDATPTPPGGSKKLGYRNPPLHGRFRKGKSGNPGGRPRGKRRAIPFDAVLGQKVEIRLNGEPTEVTAAEAFLLKLVKSGMDGDARIAALILEALEAERSARESAEHRSEPMVVQFVSPEHPSAAMRTLAMAFKADPFRPTARILLEPWLVEAALTRLGDRRLSRKEQRTVWQATRTPTKVKWPAWWTERASH